MIAALVYEQTSATLNSHCSFVVMAAIILGASSIIFLVFAQSANVLIAQSRF